MAGRRWTRKEIEYLEDHIDRYPVAVIAKRLGRSFDAVNLKLNRMGMNGFEKSTDLLTMNQVCLTIGVESRTVKKKWVDKGLKILRRGNYLLISQEDLLRYLKRHPEDWNARNVTDDSIFYGRQWYKDKRESDTEESYHWKSTEVSHLKYLRHQGFSIREIAEQMNRSESSIKYKLYYGNRKEKKDARKQEFRASG